MSGGVVHRQRRQAGALGLVALLAVLLSVPILPLAEGRSTSEPWVAPASSSPMDVASLYGESFAERAGYDGSDAVSVSDQLPAVGPQTVVVTFYPSSPSFFVPPATGARPLTVTEIADRWGLSTAAYSTAEHYFESEGLSIAQTNPTRLSLAVSGAASAIGGAFGTRLESGIYEGRAVMFPQSTPSLPTFLEPSVASVTGLSSGFVTFDLPSTPAAPLASASPAQSGDPDLITPAIARLIYDLSSLYNVSGTSHFATGEGIALLLWGDGYDPSDLSTFFANDYPSTFPPPKIQAYPVAGAPEPGSNAPSDPSKAPQELTLDMEWAGSMAPGATLDAVYAPDGPASNGYSPSVADITEALTTAVTSVPGVSVISMSFGTPEDASGPLESAWATDLATATQEGITLLAATGDFGGDADSGCTGGASVEFPSISPDVIAVGGTDPTLATNLLGQVTGIKSESAWDQSGGGFSTSILAPSWQEVGSAAAPISANGHRGVPDVSAAAAYNFLYYDGQGGVAGGTSFATPLWAGLVTEMDALYGSRLGFLTPRLYSVGASQETGRDPIGLADITTGATCIGSATKGWDTETGWGSPRALLLYEDLTATFVNLTVAATPGLVAPGGTVTVVATLSNRTSGAPISGVAVSVSLQASDGDGPCAGVWGSNELTSNASGAVRLAVAVPACYLGGHGTAEVSVTSDGYYGANSTTVAINLLGFVPALSGIQQFPQNVVAFVLIMGVAAALGYVLGRGRSRSGSSPPASRTPPGAVVAPPSPPSVAVPAPPPSAPVPAPPPGGPPVAPPP